MTAVIVIICLTVLIVTKDKNTAEIQKENNETQISENIGTKDEITVLSEGESFIIPKSEITTEAAFLPVEADGTQMEIIAVRGNDGSIRTAFNTCQICYGSGRGYYKQEGNIFVCQNCGNQFTVDDIEVESGGCNPWPIFEEDKTTTDETIEISYDYLVESKNIFANWGKIYE